MDPLSVAASIVGILAAAAKTASLLNAVAPVVSGDLPWIRRLVSEVNSSVAMLACLQKLCSEPDVVNRRGELIQADHFIATLLEGVLIFSELEVLAEKLASPGVWARISGVIKEKDIIAKISRLEGFKASTSVMLNILQCENDFEARQSQASLLSMMQELLNSNRDLARRMRNLECSITENRGSSDKSSYAASEATARATTFDLVSSDGLQEDYHQPIVAFKQNVFDFEADLETSRPYRSVRRQSMDFSFDSSVVDSNAWTALSGLSLADISVLAVLSLPIDLDEITNTHHYVASDIVTDDPLQEFWDNYEPYPYPPSLSVSTASLHRRRNAMSLPSGSTLFMQKVQSLRAAPGLQGVIGEWQPDRRRKSWLTLRWKEKK